MLECIAVTKEYRRGVQALCRFSGSFCNGIHGMLGPNGAGKSTLMNILATLIRPTQGRVLFNKQDIASMGCAYRQLLGFLPQDPPVYPWMSAREFLTYLYKVKELPLAQMNDSIELVLSQVELCDHGNDKIRTFSGGMRQRLGIAQAIMGKPEVILLDEPTAGLDPRQRAIVKNMLRVLAKDAIVFICTHIVSDLSDIADDILMLRGGRSLGIHAPGEWLSQLDGKVWWVPEQYEVLRAYPSAMHFLYQGNSGLRVISSEPPEGAIALPQTLDDMYLQCYME